MSVLKLCHSNECSSSEDTVTDLRHSELLSLQAFPVWEEEQPASEEQLGWTSSLREVTYQVRLLDSRSGV